jgi:hypothetical protein
LFRIFDLFCIHQSAAKDTDGDAALQAALQLAAQLDAEDAAQNDPVLTKVEEKVKHF